MRAIFVHAARGLLCFAVVTAAISPVSAQLKGAGLEGADVLRGAKLQTSRLNPSRLQTGKLEPTARGLARKSLDAAQLKHTAKRLARGGLSSSSLQGVASSLPPSQIGTLLLDVARELEQMDEGLAEVAVGYYMAVLASPQEQPKADARRRLREIFLDQGLSHEKAVRLYDGGLSTLAGLDRLKIGLAADGLDAGLRDLQEIKRAYHARRVASEPAEP